MSLKGSEAGSARASRAAADASSAAPNVRHRTLARRAVARVGPDCEAQSGTRAGACAPREITLCRDTELTLPD